MFSNDQPVQRLLLGENLSHELMLAEFRRKPQRVGCGIVEHVFSDAQAHTVTGELEHTESHQRVRLLELDGRAMIAVGEKPYSGLPKSVIGTVKLLKDQGKWLDSQVATEFEKNWGISPAFVRDAISNTWKRGLRFDGEERDHSGEIIRPGLRLPQVGALHAVLGHWSLTRDVATIVMPTGTGKTETMVALAVASRPTCLLVVVPTLHLVEQTVNKFLKFGFLQKSGNIASECQFPVVGRVKQRPKKVEDLELFDRCNVVVAPISAIAQGSAVEFFAEIASRCSHLILDEAHHAPADTWSTLRDAFKEKDRAILQFTATPFREDGKLIDGRIVYNYPLATAMAQGYFTKINLVSVAESDTDSADSALANEAIRVLRGDLQAGRDHILMARCKTIARAEHVVTLYRALAPDLSPIVVHSKMKETRSSIEKLSKRESRVVVCAEMLKEGFDLPNLKIAAIHDKQKSLGVLLQFVGRFTRTNGQNLGEATVVANIDSDDIAEGLDALYTEDSDWNKLLAEFSFSKITEKQRLLEFLRQSVDLTEGWQDTAGLPKVTLRAIAPRFSAVAYQATSMNENAFYKGLPAGFTVVKAWHHAESKTLIVAGSLKEIPKWSRTPVVVDETWHVVVCHLVSEKGLLFIHTSIPDYMPTPIAAAVTGKAAQVVSGDKPFKILGRINRLAYQQVGLTRRGRRSLSYSRHAGSDIGPTLERTMDGGSTKNDIFGTGYAKGQKVGVGASKRGKLWSHSAGTIQNFVDWTEETASKLTDSTIDVDALLQAIAKPTPIEVIPDVGVLNIEWPFNIRLKQAHSYEILIGGKQYSLQEADLNFVGIDPSRQSYEFEVVLDGNIARYRLTLDKTAGYTIVQTTGKEVLLQVGQIKQTLAEYFDENPPVVLFVDLSDLEGCDYYKYSYEDITFDPSLLSSRDWMGVDIRKESRMKGDVEHPDSIQAKVIEMCQEEGFAVIYDDDGANEVADLICFKETDDSVVIRLVHCKFSSSDDPGARLADVEVLASQVSRSARWLGDVHALEKQIRLRDSSRRDKGIASRFVGGDLKDLKSIIQATHHKSVKKEVVAVQPGLSERGVSDSIGRVFAAAARYVTDTTEAETRVWCSV